MGEPKTGDGKRNRSSAEMFTDNLDREQSLVRNRQRFEHDESDMEAEDEDAFSGDGHENQSCSHGDSSEITTQAEQTARRLGTMNIGEGTPGGPATRVTITAEEVPKCFVQSEVSVPISPLEMHLCSVELPTRDRAGELRPTIATRVVLTQPAGQRTHCYDLDIGTLVLCNELCLEGKKLHRQSTGASPLPVVVFRKNYLRRRIPVYNGLTAAYPDTVLVSGVTYHIIHADSESGNCFGIAAVPDQRTQVKVYSACPVYAPSAANSAGTTLWPPHYGEVYKGFRLLSQSTSVNSSSNCVGCHQGAEFSFLRGLEEVAVKAVRHHNDLFPGGEEHWHTALGEGFTDPMPLIHHQVPAGRSAPLTSKDLAPHFEQERARGRNEHLMNEIETMEFIEQGVKKAIKEFRATAGPEARCPLEGRFIGHRDVAISCDNLFIITKYTPFGSLDSYLRRGTDRVLTPLSEACTKRVVLHMLQALDFLHERGLAHQDISLENLLVQVLLSHPGLLASYRSPEVTGSLSDEHFSLLELVLIDMGHVGVHDRLPPSAGLSLSGMTVDTVATATTCESVSGCLEGEDTAAAGAAGAVTVHSRANSMDSSSSSSSEPVPAPPPTVSSPAAPPQPARRFRRRTVPQHPLGKALYRSPQISSTLNAYPRRGAAPLPPREYCGFCLDMWQLGVLAVCMLTGNTPYDLSTADTAAQEENELAWFEAVRGGRLTEYMEERARCAPSVAAASAVPSTVPSAVPSAATSAAAGPGTGTGIGPGTAVSSSASAHPAAPPPAAPAAPTAGPLCSPLGMDLLKQLLAYHEADRITARRALQHPWFQ